MFYFDVGRINRPSILSGPTRQAPWTLIEAYIGYNNIQRTTSRVQRSSRVNNKGLDVSVYRIAGGCMEAAAVAAAGMTFVFHTAHYTFLHVLLPGESFYTIAAIPGPTGSGRRSTRPVLPADSGHCVLPVPVAWWCLPSGYLPSVAGLSRLLLHASGTPCQRRRRQLSR